MNTSITPVNELLDLRGHTAIVTGASSGIGSAIALRLAEAGAGIAVHYHNNAQSAAAIVKRLQATGASACAIQADLRHESECSALLQQTTNSLGHPTILINNAGAQPVSDLIELSAVETNDVLTTNIAAPIALTRLFASLQTAATSQSTANNISVTNIASIEGLHPAAGHAHYASSKAALIMFTQAAALELGPRGIRVNAVSPGLINREGLAQNWPQGVERYKKASPLGKIGENTDIADAVLFLSSSAARWISGSNLVVDGGVSCAPTW